MAKNRHKRHGRQEGEEIARNLIEYRVYVGDKEVPCVRLVYGYTLMEADQGETIENIAARRGGMRSWNTAKIHAGTMSSYSMSLTTSQF